MRDWPLPGPLQAVASECRRLMTPALLCAVAAALLLESVTVVIGAGDAAVRATAPADILAVGTAAGALQVSALQSASLAGLLVAVAVGCGLVATDYEAGTFGLLLLVEPRRRILLLRKVVAGLVVLVLFTGAGAVAVRSSAVVARWRYSAFSPAGAPGWGACGDILVRSLVVQAAFLVVTVAVAALTRNSLATVAAVLGGTAALSPVTRTALAPAVPHYWVSGWMGFTLDDQFKTYLWNTGASSASPALCLVALTALAAIALCALDWAVRGERLLRSAD